MPTKSNTTDGVGGKRSGAGRQEKPKADKATKSMTVFPSADSLLKMLYLAMMDITKKWIGRRQGWSIIHAQLAVFLPRVCPNRWKDHSFKVAWDGTK